MHYIITGEYKVKGLRDKDKIDQVQSYPVHLHHTAVLLVQT